MITLFHYNRKSVEQKRPQCIYNVLDRSYISDKNQALEVDIITFILLIVIRHKSKNQKECLLCSDSNELISPTKSNITLKKSRNF